MKLLILFGALMGVVQCDTQSISTFRIDLVTGTEPFCGTDAKVYITLNSDKMSGPRIPLIDPSKNTFESGQTDTFIVKTVDVGKITNITIEHDNTNLFPDWFLIKIIVTNTKYNSMYTFLCYRWLSEKEPDHLIKRTFQPIVMVDGWLIIQKRTDGSANFTTNWLEYKHGFGDVRHDFWLGNEILYQLTNAGKYRLRMEVVTSKGKKLFDEYDSFSVKSEALNYFIIVGNWVPGGNGDVFRSPTETLVHNGVPFSTYDADHDRLLFAFNQFWGNCAAECGGGWWYNNCQFFNLNGPMNSDGFFYYDFSINNSTRLKQSTMKIMIAY